MLQTVFIALVPIALLIGLGHGLHRRGFLPAAFWPHAERLAYFVLLPSLFVHALATADLSGVPVAGLAAVLLPSLLVAAGVTLAIHLALPFDGPAFTSVFQGGIRFNNYVGITAALALYGPAALGLAAVANATIVPTVNVLAILVFSRYGSARAELRGVLKRICLNPLVLSCALCFVLRGSGLGLPPGIEGTLFALGQAALPLGLLCVGAALDWSALRGGLAPVLAASGIKFLVLPLVTVAVCLVTGLGGAAALVAVLFQALPTASSSYVLARQLGGDAPLMAGIITFQTVIAAVTLPATLLLAARFFEP
ncbi:AEC family transporter [soil metagenome]